MSCFVCFISMFLLDNIGGTLPAEVVDSSVGIVFRIVLFLPCDVIVDRCDKFIKHSVARRV